VGARPAKAAQQQGQQPPGQKQHFGGFQASALGVHTPAEAPTAISAVSTVASTQPTSKPSGRRHRRTGESPASSPPPRPPLGLAALPPDRPLMGRTSMLWSSDTLLASLLVPGPAASAAPCIPPAPATGRAVGGAPPAYWLCGMCEAPPRTPANTATQAAAGK
jgi:hypothetical protein